MVEVLLADKDNGQTARDLCSNIDSGSSPVSTDVYHVALSIRQELMSVKESMSWPPNSEELADMDVSIIPDSLFNLVTWLVAGDVGGCTADGGRVPVDCHIKRRVLSIAQDILYCSRGGLLKTPKHVLLPMAVHHLTRSAQLVLMLNRFGHGISLSQIQEIDTALAKEALATADNVPLPGHFEKNVSVLFAADNNDFLEETRTGANTSHVTNSIVIQRTVLSVPLCPSAQRKLRTKHCRSIENAFEPQLVQHNSSCRVGPPLFSISLPSLIPHRRDQRSSQPR